MAGKAKSDPSPLQAVSSRLSYMSALGREPLLGLTAGQVVAAMAELYPDRTYVSDLDSGYRLTFAQFHQQVAATGRALMALGVRKGDRVGVLGMNSAQWVIAQFAIPAIGAWLVNLNAAFRSEQLAVLLRHSGVCAVIAQPAFANSSYVGMLHGLAPEALEGGRPATTAFAAAAFPRLRHLVAMSGEHTGFIGWDDFLALGDSVPRAVWAERQAAVDPDDIFIICYTGGTTGAVKGALRTHRNMINNPYKVGQLLHLGPADVVATNYLLFHTAGMDAGSTMALVHGARFVIPSPGFNPAATLAAFHSEGCTVYTAAPTHLQEVLDHPDFDAGRQRLRAVLTGAAHCPVTLARRMERSTGAATCIGYGGTEAGAFSFTTPDDPPHRRHGTVGQVGLHSEGKVIDPATGRIVPRGEPGEVCVRGFTVMVGYHDAPELTAQVLDSAGWYHTSDLGVMDPGGYLRILGRMDEVIIRGAEKITPLDVETVIRSFPGVRDAQVVGIPDPHYGQEIAAWVVAAGAALDSDALRAHCAERLAFYQVPRWFLTTAAFPLTGVGKPDRAKLRQLADEHVGSLQRATDES